MTFNENLLNLLKTLHYISGNSRSPNPLEQKAIEIISQNRAKTTPIIFARQLGRAEEKVEFKPEISLKHGLKRTVDWFISQQQ